MFKRNLFIGLLMVMLGFEAKAQVTLSFTDFYGGEKLENVTVYSGDQLVGSSGPEGRLVLDKAALSSGLIASKEGYQAHSLTIPAGQDQLRIAMRPVTYDLPEGVNITSNRTEIAALNTAAAVSVLTDQTLAQNRPRSMAEALIGVPGVWIQKTNHGGGSAFVRGLTGNQTLLLVDGIRMNNATYRYGPNQYLNTVDPLSVYRVEVLRGQGSVQYGSDAIGGTVNLRTQPLEFSQGGRTVQGNLYGKYMGYNMEATGRADLSLSSAKVAFRGGVSEKHFGDLVAGGDLGVEAPSSYQERDMDAKLQLQLSGRDQLTLLAQQVTQRHVGRYDQVAQRGYALYEFEPQRRQLAYARWEHSPTLPYLDKIETTLSWQQSLEGRLKQKVGEDFRSEEEDRVNTLGFSVLAISSHGKWSGVHGVESYGDKVRSSAQRVDTLTGGISLRRGLYPDGASAGQVGIFSLHKLDHRHWQLDAGLRGNFFRVRATDETFGDLSISPSALVGNAAFIWKVTARQSAILSYNTGFRSPNIDDLSSFGSFDSGIEVPSPDLKPEHSSTWELGYKRAGDMLGWEFSAYQTSLSDLITRVRSSWQGADSLNGEQVYQKANTARAVIRGAEARVFFLPMEGMTIESSVAYTFGEDLSKAEPLRRIPPIFGRTLLTYRRSNFWGSAEWLYAGAQTRLSGGDIDDHRIAAGGTPGWQVVNIRAGYTFRQLSLSAGAENLFNEAYRMHGSGVDGMGRNAWVAVCWSW